MSKRDWRAISIVTISVGIISLYCACITFSYSEWEPSTMGRGHIKNPFRQYSSSLLIIGVPFTALGLGSAYMHMRSEIMKRRKKLLMIATIILLAITIIWAVALYQHILAYNRMLQVYEELELYGLPKPLFEWRNGPILMVSGCILAFAWIFLIAGWWKVLSSKTNPCMHPNPET